MEFFCAPSLDFTLRSLSTSALGIGGKPECLPAGALAIRGIALSLVERLLVTRVFGSCPLRRCVLTFLSGREEDFHAWPASPKQSGGQQQTKYSQNKKDGDYRVV